MVARLKRIWGGALAGERSSQKPPGWFDFLLLIGVFGLFYGLFHIAGQWSSVMRAKVEIDLSPWMLPWYTFQSLMRGIFAYVLSLIFTLIYGYWAAKDARASPSSASCPDSCSPWWRSSRRAIPASNWRRC